MFYQYLYLVYICSYFCLHSLGCLVAKKANKSVAICYKPQRGCRLGIITDQDLCKSDLEQFFLSIDADNFFYFYADYSISNNICQFATFEKSKTTVSNWIID